MYIYIYIHIYMYWLAPYIVAAGGGGGGHCPDIRGRRGLSLTAMLHTKNCRTYVHTYIYIYIYTYTYIHTFSYRGSRILPCLRAVTSDWYYS